MSKLLIVESPAKAKTISKYLDDRYIVKASVGHVRDLPKSNKKAIDIPGGFIPHYEISKGKENVIDELAKLAKKSEEVVLAMDADREGEAIAWHLKEILKLKNPKRIVFHEITEDAVKEAINHPREIDDNLKSAQEARRVLDRLVGYDLSGLIWKKVRYGLSAGRVKSPALRIIMEKEREIRAFVPEDYWTIIANVSNADGNFQIGCVEEPRDKKLVEKILEYGKTNSWIVSTIKESEMKRTPKAPFITSTLQQTASSRLGFAPSKTMGIAQKLYEAGHITYMRTDSTTLGSQALVQIKTVVEKNYGKEYLEFRTFKKKSKGAQEAHEAIRPTNSSKEVAGTTNEQKQLYNLIWSRTVASQMTDAKLKKTKLLVTVGDGTIPDFAVNGSRVVFLGWLKADPAASGEDTEVPNVSINDELTLLEINSEAKQTQPPNRYSEASLIKELEKRGIGRPSTYASIMRTIIERGYVDKEGKTLIPTDTGDVVSSFLEEHFTKYVSDDFTAEMEEELDEIAEGKRTYKKTLTDFYGPFLKQVQSKEDIEKITNLGDAPEEFTCPKCGKNMIIKLGRGGKFISCSTFPDCDGARTIEGLELQPDEPIAKDPETGDHIYLLHGRFGPYVQLGEKTKENPKPKRGSVPKEVDLENITEAMAVKYLSIPRTLGKHPETNKEVKASIGRFGPYVVHDGEFRSIKAPDDVYEITLERAVELLAEEKIPHGAKIAMRLGKHEKKQINVFENKSGLFIKKGRRNIYLGEEIKLTTFTLEDAVNLLDK